MFKRKENLNNINQFNSKSDKSMGGDFSIIGENMSIKGDINSNGNIRIDGKIEGNITAKAKIILGPKSFVQGNINAKTADIEGSVNGILEISELLTLKSTATVQGETKVGSIAIEQGAKFDAVCKYNGVISKETVSNSK